MLQLRIILQTFPLIHPGKKYDKLEDAYNAYQKLLADGTYPN